MLSHKWNITPREAIALQKELAGQVIVEQIDRRVETIAGTDCAFIGKDRIVAVAALFDARRFELITSRTVVMPVSFPYVPGLLSFREGPAIIAAIEQLPRRPDLVMMDGQGLAHPRGLGIASHVGLWLDIATIGVAKSRLCGEHRSPGRRRGCRTQLRLGDTVVGAVLRTQDAVKPLYVSVGHRVTLIEAVSWTLRAARRFRLPEPTRRAHQLVTQEKGKLKPAPPSEYT